MALEYIVDTQRNEFMTTLYDLTTSRGHVCGMRVVFTPGEVVENLEGLVLVVGRFAL